MGAEYINPQWRLPNYKTGNNQSYSMDFDGTEYINAGRLLSSENTSTLSVSFWLKIPSTGAKSYLGYWDHPNGWLIEADAYSVYFAIGNTSYNALKLGYSGNISINTWYHIAMVFDGTQTGNANRLKVYLNGTQKTLTTSGSSVIPASIPSIPNAVVTIGGITPSTVNGAKSIDEVAIFDYALPATGSNSVATLYNSGTPFNPMALASPPIAYYPLGNSAHMGSNYLTPNGAVQDYVFEIGSTPKSINSGTITDLNSDMAELSVSIWLKKTGSTSPGDYAILGKAGANDPTSFGLYWKRDAYATQGVNTAFKINNGSVQAVGGQSNTGNEVAITMEDNKWYHIVGTYDGTTQSLYINGNLHDYKSTSGNITGVSDNFILGKGIYYFYNWLGELSNCMIWTKGLSQSEVTTLYNYGSPIKTLSSIPQNSDLKVWYKLDASEIYNSTSTEWSVDNNANTSTYDTSINLVRASSQKIDIANGSELDFTGDFTMSIWVNLTSSNNMGVFNKTSAANSNGVSLFKRGGANFEFYVSEYSNVLTFASQGDNIWQQITITLNRTTGERIAYVNGEQAATLTHIKTFTFPNQGWDIGTFATNSSNYLDAKVSNFKLFNTVLSPTEVQTLYNNGTPLTDMSLFTSLQGWWKLNNLSSGLTDSSSNSNTATVTSGTNEYAGFVNALAGDSSGMNQSNLVQSDLLTTSSYSPYALNFDGNDYIDCGNDSSLALTSNFSVSAWVKSSNIGLYAIAVSKNSGNNGFSLQMRGQNNQFKFNINDGSWQSAIYSGINPIDDGKWHHVLGTFDGSTIKIYVDNIKGTDSSCGTMTSNTVNLRIGAETSGNYFNGQISNVSYWNTALTQAQVTELYAEGVPQNLLNHSAASSLVSWWQLGSNSSFNTNWTVLDEKGSNNGTSANMLENAIVDGVGTSGNGTSTNMGTATNISGSSPNGEANSLSVNMTTANLTTGVV